MKKIMISKNLIKPGVFCQFSIYGSRNVEKTLVFIGFSKIMKSQMSEKAYKT